MSDDWRKLATAASVEKDREKLLVLIDSLIEAFEQEEKRIREEIDALIEYRVCFMEQQGLGPSVKK